MIVNVKLFGTLPKHVGHYDTRTGITVELPEGADVDRLLEKLGIPASRHGMVSVDGKLVKASHRLRGGEDVYIFQRIFGG
jgi:sulfur carrier protein ThiS